MIIGYALTAVYAILLCALVVCAVISRKDIAKAFKGKIDRYTCLIAIVMILFFVIFSLLYVSPVEQLYFDENIYQGVALNILHNGNALWCQYGSAYLTNCPYSQIYHDPVEWSFYIAIAFLFFGAGTATAYGLQLLTGALSILLVFLLGSLLLGKRGGTASTIIFALIPELFIWSRTQAAPDLGLMAFSILAFLCYSIYDIKRDPKTLALFLSALGIAVYIRIEAALLIPIFLLVYIFGDSNLNLRKNIRSVVSARINMNAILIFLFFVCMIPQIYYIIYESASLDYGSGTICNIPSNHTFSVNNFLCNVGPNTSFFAGFYNSTGYFPAYFSVETTIIAIIGLIALLVIKLKNRRKLLLMLGAWILVYHLFYDFFYAGSVLYGVDVRFMLQIYPAIAIFGAIGIDELSKAIGSGLMRALRFRSKYVLARFSAIAFVILILVFAIYPFVSAISAITLLPQNMPQEPGPLTASNFIYTNYADVPPHCLVFSFTPDIWYELNRSAAQVGYLDSTDVNFTAFSSNYSCFVLDYGYWCAVPPFNTGTCRTDITNYNVSAIISQTPAPGESGNLTLYLIRNYTTADLRNSSFKN